MPFTYFAALIPQDLTPGQLHGMYLSLFEEACCAVEKFTASNPESGPQLLSYQEGSSRISYNLGLTETSIVICPRRAEGMALPLDQSPGIHNVALNGTVLAGTLLVKNEIEWEELKMNESLLQEVLEAIGIPL